MKAILVIDIGNDDINSYEVCIRKTNRDTDVEWEKEEKLKPLPAEFKTYKLSPRDQEETELLINMAMIKVYADGWNDCLKEIEK